MEGETNNRELESTELENEVPATAEPAVFQSPLERLRDTEQWLRHRTLGTIVPVLPEEAALKVQEASEVADETLEQLAAIDLTSIDDRALRSPRIFMGLAFVGFGALMILFLLVYLSATHPELNAIDRIQNYWYQYVWFVCVGIAGMFMLGREAMRPAFKAKPEDLEALEEDPETSEQV